MLHLFIIYFKAKEANVFALFDIVDSCCTVDSRGTKKPKNVTVFYRGAKALYQLAIGHNFVMYYLTVRFV